MIRVDMKEFKLKKAAERHKALLTAYAEAAAQTLEGEAKLKAPWKDRTGHARQSIQGTSGWENDELKIVLSGGMEYSVYLELAHEKKYAILKPTIDKNAAYILKGYQKLVKDRHVETDIR